MERHTDRQTDKNTKTQKYRQTDRQRDDRTVRQSGRQAPPLAWLTVENRVAECHIPIVIIFGGRQFSIIFIVSGRPFLYISFFTGAKFNLF